MPKLFISPWLNKILPCPTVSFWKTGFKFLLIGIPPDLDGDFDDDTPPPVVRDFDLLANFVGVDVTSSTEEGSLATPPLLSFGEFNFFSFWALSAAINDIFEAIIGGEVLTIESDVPAGNKRVLRKMNQNFAQFFRRYK